MPKFMKRIGIIAPNKEIYHLAQKVSRESGSVISIYEGNLEEGVEAARFAISRGNDVLISRGGTALSIEEKLNIPVVYIDFSGIDMLKTIESAKKHANSFAILGHENLFGNNKGVHLISGYTLYIDKFAAYHEIKEQIVKLKDKYGVEVFIGGDAVIEEAQKLGFQGVLMDCGIASVRKAVGEAIRIAKMQALEAERYVQFIAVTEHSSDGIILLSKENMVKYLNPVAKKMMKVFGNGKVGDVYLEAFFPSLLKSVQDRRPAHQVYETVKDTRVIATYIPLSLGELSLGGLISFQDVTRIEELERKIRREQYAKGLLAKYNFSDILTVDRGMETIIKQTKKIASTDCSVLITGESGTGKELIAQSIHNGSARKSGPFVAVNCAALPESILESELFGYVDGAFTGARKNGKPGLFEQAHLGTIFLDEIGDVPLNVQSRLLRVIQEKEVSRVGDDKIIPVSIRIISATNKDLRVLVEEGKIREDLFYRLDIVRIKLPPLRERLDDLPFLCRHFAERYWQANKLKPKEFSREAIELLKEYSWPGNIRELQNFVESLVIITDPDEIIDEAIINHFLKDKLGYSYQHEKAFLPNKEKGILKKKEAQTIFDALNQTNGNKTKAAKLLGISTTTLWRKLKLMGKKRSPC